ncbi:class I SAM-dependent methyltransferase [Paenibacillus marinisediminis]
MNNPWKNNKFATESLLRVDNKFLTGTKQEVDFIERKLGIINGDRVLDLGCGAGRHSIEMASRGYLMDGVDISETMLSAAHQRAAEANVNINFYNQDLKDLHMLFPEESIFNGAICLCESGLGVLGGVAEDINFLRSVYRLLQPRCKFILTDFNGLRRYLHSRDNNPKFDYINGIIHWSCSIEENEILQEKQRLYIPSELKMLFEFAGFKDVIIYGCSPGNFREQILVIDEIEMMVIATKV